MSVLNDASAGDTTLGVYDEEGLTKPGDELWVGIGSTREKVVVTAVTEAADPGPQFGPPTGTLPAGCVRSDALTACPTGLTLAEPLQYDHVGLDSTQKTRQRGEVISAFDSVEVTLAGQGVPYLLDASTGEVSAIAEYVSNGDSVTLDLEIGASEAAIVGVISNTAGFPAVEDLHAVSTTGGKVVYNAEGKLALQAESAGSYTVELSDGTSRVVNVPSVPAAPDLSEGWKLTIESWGPDAELNPVIPTVSKKVNVTFASVTLGPWMDTLALTNAQKTALDVTEVSQISGNATYEQTITLPADWDGSTVGATVLLEHYYDNITGVKVNDVDVPVVDQFNDTASLPASAFKAGANTITVTIGTSLANRVGSSGNWVTQSQNQGLRSVILTPSVTVPLQALTGTDPQGNLNNIETRSGGIWVRGWVADNDAPTTAIQAKVVIGDGSAAETFLLDANLWRSDITRTYPQFGTDHGFNQTVSTAKTGTQQVYVYAVNVGGGADKLIAVRTITITGAAG
jgi:hypothetical protein